jgi:hypothetical protein
VAEAHRISTTAHDAHVVRKRLLLIDHCDPPSEYTEYNVEWK